jgi:hypothetical protein
MRLLVRHRDLDKVALLLKLNGYVVSVRACRRAIEHLVLDPFDDLDPYGIRSFATPETVASEAAERLIKQRPRTETERAGRRRDTTRAGGRDHLARQLTSVLLPLFGGFDRAALLEVIDRFGIGDVARGLHTAVPGVAETVAADAEAGVLHVDHIRAELLPRLTAEDYDTFVRASRVLLAAIESLGLTLTPSDPFVSDCLAALRRPDHQLLPPPAASTTGEAEAERAALHFFAQHRAKTTD